MFILLSLTGFPASGQDDSRNRCSTSFEHFPEVTTGDHDNSHLRFLDSIAGNARVFFLGEHSHDDYWASAAKLRVMKYLHEVHGYDVLLIEMDVLSVYYNMLGVSEGRDSILGAWATIAPGGVDKMTRGYYDLAVYMQGRANAGDTITVQGLDVAFIPSPYRRAFILDLEALLRETHPAYPGSEEEKAFNEVFQKGRYFRKMNIDDEYDMWEGLGFETIRRDIDILSAHLQEEASRCGSSGEKDRISIFVLILKSIKGYWDNWLNSYISEQDRSRGTGTGDYYRIRDRYMAEMLLYWVNEHYRDKKVVVSTSTYHVTRNRGSFKTQPRFYSEGTRPMLDIAYDSIQGGAHSIAFISPGYWTDKWRNYPRHNKGIFGWKLKRSVEGRIRSYPGQDLYLDLRKHRACSDCTVDRLWSYPSFERPQRGNWTDMYDGFYIYREYKKKDRILLEGRGQNWKCDCDLPDEYFRD